MLQSSHGPGSLNSAAMTLLAVLRLSCWPQVPVIYRMAGVQGFLHP